MPVYEDERREMLREQLKFAEVFARREAAKMKLLEEVMQGEIDAESLYKMIAATEGVGLYGIEHPVDHKDWNLLREQITRYILFSRRLTKDELLPLELIIKEQAADIAARSRNLYSIQPLLQVDQIQDRMDWLRRSRKPLVAGDGEE